jgi:hypothetical protein
VIQKLGKKITLHNNDQYILISALAAISYVIWVLYEPTLGFCVSSHHLFTTIRIALFLLWLIYIVKFRAKNKVFDWKNFACGALSGGYAFAIVATAWSLKNPIDNPIHPILANFQLLVMMAPTSTISGLYASFALNKKGAFLQGFYVLILQFFIFILATIPILCVY